MAADGPACDRAPARDAYERMADAFAAAVADKPHNALYDRPATWSLLPDVAGARVLDAGCAPGQYLVELAARGARAVGVDVAAAMLRHARRRAAAGLAQVDLGAPLPFADASFDIVLSALTLDYVADWRAAFREFARVLVPGGVLVCSFENPASAAVLAAVDRYLAVERRESRFPSFGVTVPAWRRPFAEALNPLLEAGLVLERVHEGEPAVAFAARDPEAYARLLRGPGFLHLRARRPREA